MKNFIIVFTFIFNLAACAQESITTFEVSKTRSEWKNQLDSLSFEVLRNKGTEVAFSGAYWNTKDNGTYVCKGCNNALFDSKTKYVSGTGWPSFYESSYNNAVLEKADTTFGWQRVEIICAKCGGHLGHVFNDGPPPTGKRYCVNSASLLFMKED